MVANDIPPDERERGTRKSVNGFDLVLMDLVQSSNLRVEKIGPSMGPNYTEP